MLYGFDQDGVIVIAAADSSQEYENAGTILARMNAGFNRLSLNEMTADERYRGFHVPPLIVSQGYLDDSKIELSSRETVLIKQREMVYSQGDDIAEMARLFISSGVRAPTRIEATLDGRHLSERETADALNISLPIAPNDFVFWSEAHPEKKSVFTVFGLAQNWMRDRQRDRSVFLSPLISDFLPVGFSEFLPGVFECLGDVHDVQQQLVLRGCMEAISLSSELQPFISSIKPSPRPEPTKQVGWDESNTSWDHMSSEQQFKRLPNGEISFCVTGGEFGTEVHLVPTSYFEQHGSLLDKDLQFADRLMGDPEPIGNNAFRYPGIDILDISASLTQSGFIDNYDLLLYVNLLDFGG